ncbi:motile sperm domain-containing protein 2 [Dermatophagoides farinae]|uniref:motile sperm domain-containing protein 2 n=1 Tax=Dermatophagoides farinae TaxID=6954 RepID=UPI003F619EBF
MPSGSNSIDLSIMIERIRERLEREFGENETLYHPNDIERIRTDSWQIERYIEEYHHNEDKAYDAIVKTLKWRKSERVNEIRETDFFKEMWTFTSVEIHGHDRQGRVLHWVTLQNITVPKDIMDLGFRFTLYISEQIDKLAGRKGCTTVVNVRHAGLRNFQIDIIRMLLTIPQHYPGLVRMFLVVDQPYLLRTVINILLNVVDEKIRKRMAFISNADLTKYVDPKLIPKSMNGMRTKLFQPTNIPSVKDCYERLGLGMKICDEVDKALNIVKKHLI